jgi:hypothetical protein
VSTDPGPASVSAMTDEQFEEWLWCLVQWLGGGRENLEVLMPVVTQLHGYPVRMVAVWFAGFVIQEVREMDSLDRDWVSAVLRRTADLVDKIHEGKDSC